MRTPEQVITTLVRAMPELDVDKIVKRDASLEHNARESLGAIANQIVEFEKRYVPDAR